MESFQRARKPEQKSQRLEVILQAASSLMEEMPFDELSMRMLAERAGLGKASLYHYFSTKESVFLALFIKQFESWTADFCERMGRMRKPSAEKVAGLITELMLAHSQLSNLMALVSGVLERNVSVEELRDFKTQLLPHLGQITELLCKAVPDFDKKKAGEFVLQFHATISGLWPMAHPNENYKEAIDVEHLKVFKVDFRSMCKKMLLRFLQD